jgi:Tfp pilus assembly PilM family ATPase
LARFLAIDWDHNQLHIVAATARRGAVQIDKAVVWQDPRVPNLGEAEVLGKALRERLKEAGIAPAPVLACVGRDRVILKDLRFPAVPDAEEPAVVRFQAVKELTDPPDEVVIDYCCVGNGNGNGERRALALIARRELVQAYRTLCQSAGLKFAGMSPRAFGVAASLSRVMGSSTVTPAPEPPDASVAAVALGEGWGEFCVVREGELFFTRSIDPGPGLAGEIRRNLAVYAGQAPHMPIRAVYVAGGSEQASLRERLRDMLDVPVHAFDPFSGSERSDLPHTGRGGFAGAIGLLYSDELPINFTKPREPKPVKDPNQRRLVLAAGLAASLLFAGGVYGYMRLSTLDRQVTEQRNRNDDLDRTLLMLGEEDKKFKALSDWDRKGVVLLDELYDVTEKIGDTRTIRLSRFASGPLDNPKDKKVVRISLEGLTTSDAKQANRFIDELNREGHRRMEVMGTSETQGPIRAQGFTRRFTQNVDVEKPPPSAYGVRLPDVARPEDGGGEQ